MDISEFKRVLTAFADEPTDVDIRLGKVVAQIRDDIVDATISFGPENQLYITENDERFTARSWLINRVARVQQLAERIIVTTTVQPQVAKYSPFITPSGALSADISSPNLDDLAVSNVVACLRLRASEPQPGATSVLYITSDAGEGKTTVINRAAREQALAFKEKTVGSLIVPIPLSGKAFLTFDDAVIAALVNKLRFNYLYYDAFLHLVRLGVVIPAFDGYEEMLVEGSKGEAVSALGNMVQSLESSGTVFIAARKAFFEYVSFKTQAKFLDAIGDRAASFSRLDVHRWTKGQFCAYGQLRGVTDPEAIYETVEMRLDSEHPLLTRAVLVKRLFDVASGVADRPALAALLGNSPHDYFYTFVDAIVKREAAEKWLVNVSGDVLEPLLSVEEHHLLLEQIALEMWQTSKNALRHEVLDLVVELFAEAHSKNAGVTRQIKERVRQHSLLATDGSLGKSLAFDHEDFQNFYLGEGLGQLLARSIRAELQAFLSVNIVPAATIEQAVQYALRTKADTKKALDVVFSICASESAFSICKENCSVLALRLCECLDALRPVVVLEEMYFAVGALSSRDLKNMTFRRCHFQPTSTASSKFASVSFDECEFERLEACAPSGLAGCTFERCRLDSFLASEEDALNFDPSVIRLLACAAGANFGDDAGTIEIADCEQDGRLKAFEKFLRAFLRGTHVDDAFIRLRLGKNHASLFFDEVLPDLLSSQVLEEIPWKGQGVQHRYKLIMPMATINQSLERARGSYDRFLTEIGFDF